MNQAGSADGHPGRHALSHGFLALAAGAGATSAITDPMKPTATIRAIDLLMGRDAYAGRYVRHWWQQRAKE